MALPPKFDAGGTSGVTGSVTVKVPAWANPLLVATSTVPVVAVGGMVNTNCVVLALVIVAAVPVVVPRVALFETSVVTVPVVMVALVETVLFPVAVP